MKRTVFALLCSAGLAGSALAAQPEPSAPSTVVTVAVGGPLTLQANLASTDIEVVRGAVNTVRAQLFPCARQSWRLWSHCGGASRAIRLNTFSNRVEVQFLSKDGTPQAAGVGGRVRVELPAGSAVAIMSASGDLSIRDLGGNVQLRTASGDVHLRQVANVEAMTASGDIIIEGSSGELRLRTASGDATVTQAGGAKGFELGTTSGDLDWSGACGAGCRIDVRSTSGDVRLRLARSSSFALHYVTRSGDAVDGLGVQALENNGDTSSMNGRYGKGEGLIQAQTVSGDLAVVAQ
jgi:hypothetical protein